MESGEIVARVGSLLLLVCLFGSMITITTPYFLYFAVPVALYVIFLIGMYIIELLFGTEDCNI